MTISETEKGAILLWHRFAAAHHLEWEDEPNKDEYRRAAADLIALAQSEREAVLEAALREAIRCAELALFVIRKQGVMPNSSWEFGFNSDLDAAKAALTTPCPSVSREEIVAAVEAGLALIDDMSRFVGQMSLQDYALFNEAPMKLRSLLNRLQGEGFGHSTGIPSALEQAFLETREFLGLLEPLVCDCSCPSKWPSDEPQPHSKLHHDLRDVLYRHEGAVAAALRAHASMEQS